MLTFAQFGAGRIGAIHAANLSQIENAGLRYIVDVNANAADKLACKYGAKRVDERTALADPDIDAVIIASSTDTHARLIIAAADAGKAIFCEKPIDLSLARVDECLRHARSAGVPLFIGFNRRFDPSFAELHQRICAGDIGVVEQVVVTSRDPGAPPLSYIRVSGGQLRDMTIHDFDMASWLLGEEPVDVFAFGSCITDKKIGEAGDTDSLMIVMKTASGKLAHINNSRRASYGYDQRVEVHGSTGRLVAGNRTATSVEFSNAIAVSTGTPLNFFLERYADAYRIELAAFIDAVNHKRPMPVSGQDGRQAMALAEAALESLRTGRSVKPALFSPP